MDDLLSIGLPPETVSALQEAIESEYGIAFRKDKLSALSGLVRERMRARRIASIEEYGAEIVRGPGHREELKSLALALVVGETSFFRMPRQFQVFQDHVLPELASHGVGIPLTIWSAGCATGEEPYSIAIAALESFRGRFREPVRILATDIHPLFLDTAREGIYPASSGKSVPPPLLRKYFTELPDGMFRVNPEVRRLVSFEEGNLSGFHHSSLGSLRYSVIFCRNTMIYFRRETTRTLVAQYFECLHDGGVMFLGHSEALWGISDAFRLEERDGVFFYRKRKGKPDPSRPEHRKVPANPPLPPTASRMANADPRPAAMDLVHQAESLADRGALGEAEDLCREAIARDPECTDASYLMAVLLRRSGRVSEALFYANRAVSSDPRFILAMVETAECLHLLGRTREAVHRWQQALHLLEHHVRFPRIGPTAGFSANSLREYVAARLER